MSILFVVKGTEIIRGLESLRANRLLHFTLQIYYKNSSISLKIVRALWIFVQFGNLNAFRFFGNKFNDLICILHLPLRQNF